MRYTTLKLINRVSNSLERLYEPDTTARKVYRVERILGHGHAEFDNIGDLMYFIVSRKYTSFDVLVTVTFPDYDNLTIELS